MNKIITSFSLALLIVGALVTNGTRAEPASQPAAMPKYQLKVGQELIYEMTGKGVSDGETDLNTRKWTLWVTAENPTGTWELLILYELANWRGPRPEEHKDGSSERFVVTGTLHPDGTLDLPEKLAERANPTLFDLFIQLPHDDAQAKQGYTTPTSDGEIFRTAVEQRTAKEWKIRATREGAEEEIYDLHRSALATFDPQQGLITAVELTATQGYGFHSKMTAVVELKKNELHDAEWIQDAAKDAQLLNLSLTKYWEEINAARHGLAADVEKHITTARSAVEMASSMAATPEVRAYLDEQVEGDKSVMIKSIKRNVARREKMVGQPAPEWELDSVSGKKLALKNFRGKVVVLDFWYRGCGYCIKAMPQMKLLDEDFKARDVVILGMNTDTKLADALFVIDRMKLNYESLRAPADLPEQYAVEGFPTLIIIDKKGIIRETHIGYSPTLRKDVSATLEKLLKE